MTTHIHAPGDSEMTGCVETITPALASTYLSMSKGNRVIRRGRLAKYMTDLRNGRWSLHHQGLAFDVDGVFRDGHHRLEMVIETGITTKFFVMRNVPKEGLMEIDAVLPRSARDALRMADKGDFTSRMVAVARSFKLWPVLSKSGTLSIHDVLRALDDYSGGICFACDRIPIGPGITKAVRVLCARAFYHVDAERLSEWCKVIHEGMPIDPQSDSAAIMYRNFLVRNIGLSGWGIENERYRKGSNCLKLFTLRQPTTKCFATHEDLYPVMQDEQDDES